MIAKGDGSCVVERGLKTYRPKGPVNPDSRLRPEKTGGIFMTGGGLRGKDEGH